MLKIGLTGGIGSGKSVVAAIFSVLGIPVFDADRQAKLLMENDEQLSQSIKDLFGNLSFINGKLDRAYLAKIVFNNKAKLDKLNALVHPAIIQAANDWMRGQTTKYVIKEAALLFESGSTSDLDYVIGVSAPEEVRLQRVIERDGATKDQIFGRMKHQINETIKMKLCDEVIINDDHSLLIPQVIKIHEKLIDINNIHSI